MSYKQFNRSSYSQILRTIKQIVHKSNNDVTRFRHFSSSAYTGRYSFETLDVSSPSEHVLHVVINRPDIYNAINKDMFREILECFNGINDDTQCRAVVISGHGKEFSAGVDYTDMKEFMVRIAGSNASPGHAPQDVARKAKFIRSMVSLYQESFNSIEKCTKPVIAAIHGACRGTALALIAASDIRYSSQDAYFQIKEVDTGMAPAMGTIQRLPKVIGNDSLFRELVYTSRKMSSREAKEMGLISKIFADPETTKQAAIELAQEIATKSPVAVQGSKISMKYSRDHSVQDGLKFMANWNMVMLQSEDMHKAATAVASKSTSQPDFGDY